ncbi:MAG TPA: polysaccharide biosynthesis/export family protein [bacterium]|nr:polysaccharide biosynthesis/export family protein [bacterium]HPG82851.1 polysaccharide biosynthesis/export family protein [bacterium]HPM60094.1 polysaccharide biosynthesis/export family protein [bacterium]
MKDKWFRRRWPAAGVAMLFTVMISGCSVRPHSTAEIDGSNKVIVASAPAREAEAGKEKVQKRTKVVRKSTKAKEQQQVQPEKSAPSPQIVEAKAEPARAYVPGMVYRLGFGDVIDIKFLASPEYNETVSIRPDGRISLQGVGELDALGLSPAELDSVVTAAYAQLLVHPDVTVIVREFGGQKCYVAGEVDHPGSMDVAKGMTLLRAIASAGGPKKSAKMGSVILIRMDGEQRAEATRIDLSYTSMKGGIENDLPVMGNDIIYVPRTFIADVNAFVSQVYDVVLPPFDSWTRYFYWYRGLR